MHAFRRQRRIARSGTPSLPSRRGQRQRHELRLERLETRHMLAGTMVKDILPGPAGGLTDTFSLASVDGTLFFSASGIDGSGQELWKSDGTSRGTTLVTDINPGFNADGYPYSSRPDQLTNVHGLVAFLAGTQTQGIELWRTDGTSSGTSIVKDIVPDGASGPSYDQLIVAGDRLFFTLDSDNTGRELWSWFPSEQGSLVGMVQNIAYGSASSDPLELTVVGDDLYFTADNGTKGRELWKADGLGAFMVKDIYRNLFGGGSSDPHDLVDVDGTLYFVANDGVHGDELWQSDGTAAGTVMLGETIAGSESARPRDLVNVNGTLFFNATNAANGTALWKYNTNGRTGTVPTLVADINVKANYNGYSQDEAVSFLGSVGDILLFYADDGIHGRELWKTDGSSGGTSIVKDVNTGSGDSRFSGRFYDNKSLVVDGRLFFTAYDADHGYALWITDGTSAGTRLVNDFDSGHASAYDEYKIAQLTSVDGTLFFTADDGVHGQELWSLQALRPTAGGPYFVPENGSVTLSAVGSTCDPGSTITSYAWDFDYDGVTFTPNAISPFPTATFDAFGIDGDAVRTVAVQIRDELGRSSIATAVVTIKNVAPTASITGPSVGVRGQTLSFNLTASDPSTFDMLVGFTYKIDFGEGSGVTTIPLYAYNGSNGTGDVNVNYLYTKAGTYTIRVTATDCSGDAGPVTTFPVTIAAAAVRPDPADPALNHLYVGGTTSADTIRINPGPTADKIRVVIGNAVVGTYAKPNGRVIVFGQAGDDVITVAPTLTVPAELHGDDGADRLTGGGGKDILLGGKGADQLNGGAADDILIAGNTAYDTDIVAWSGIFDEWNGTGTYAAKLANLLAGTGLNDPYLLKGGMGATVFNDGSIDSLTGGLGNDAYFTSIGDTVADLAKGETNTAIVGPAPALSMAKLFAAAGSQPPSAGPSKTSGITSLKAKIFGVLGQ